MTQHLISLAHLEKNQSAIIHKVDAAHRATKRLADMGLTPNTKITVIRKALFRGPIEIKARGSNLILGRAIAAKITVKIV